MKDTFTPGQGQGQDPGQGNDGNGQGQPPAPTAMTPAQLQAILQENQAPLAEAITDLARRVEAVNRASAGTGQGQGNGQGTGKGRGGNAGGAPGEDDFVSELLADGRTVVQREAAGVFNEFFQQHLAPYFSQRLPADRDAAIADNRARIDSDYGQGFFDEHVMPMLLSKDGKSGALATMKLGDQSLPHVVAATVDGVLGRVMADPNTRAKMLEGLQKTEQARAAQRKTLNPPRQLGPGLPRGVKPTDVEIPDQVRDSLADLRRQGIDFSEAELLDTLSRGTSEDDWADVLKPAKGGGRAA